MGPETHVHKITNPPVFFMEQEVMDFWREICITCVPDSKSRNIPEVVVVWHWTVGVWEFGRGGIAG